ncbi:MAG TPA: hypothetical protein VFA04_17520 [Bryobacteraceae bacterium]|nr:hypothetical protein [Bryobacteraceae bacterium]
MDEERALRQIDETLDAALGGITAPPGFAARVRRRVREPRLSRAPEILDAIGWLAVLALVFVVALLWLPPGTNTAAAVAVAGIAVAPAAVFGIRTLREL